MLKEIKLKYSTQRFFDLRNKYLNTNSMEVELTTHTYIDNFHLFLEIRKDVESILDLLYQADQFYLEAYPDIKTKRSINQSQLPLELDRFPDDFHAPDLELEKNKLLGLAENYFKNFEGMIRDSFNKKGIEKILGNLNDDERKKVRFYPTKAFEITNIKNLDVIDFLEMLYDESNESRYPLYDLFLIYKFKDIIQNFNSSVKINFEYDVKFDAILRPKFNSKDEIIFKTLLARSASKSQKIKIKKTITEFLKKFNGSKHDENKDFERLSFLFFNDQYCNELYQREKRVLKEFIKDDMQIFLKFLDYLFNPKETLHHCDGTVFLKMNFFYNIFRAQMSVEEFKKESKKRNIRLTQEDIELYENFSYLFQESLKNTKTTLGKYKWKRYSFEEKQVDMSLGLACQEKMLECKYEKKINNLFCAITNDSDFVPLYKQGKKHNCDIYLCSVVQQRYLSKDLRNIIDKTKIIFPKKWNLTEIIEMIFSKLKHVPHYDDEDPGFFHRVKPNRELIEIIENQEYRKNLLVRIEQRIKQEILDLKTTKSKSKTISENLSKTSERFLNYDENILFFNRKNFG